MVGKKGNDGARDLWPVLNFQALEDVSVNGRVRGIAQQDDEERQRVRLQIHALETAQCVLRHVLPVGIKEHLADEPLVLSVGARLGQESIERDQRVPAHLGRILFLGVLHEHLPGLGSQTGATEVPEDVHHRDLHVEDSTPLAVEQTKHQRVEGRLLAHRSAVERVAETGHEVFLEIEGLPGQSIEQELYRRLAPDTGQRRDDGALALAVRLRVETLQLRRGLRSDGRHHRHRVLAEDPVAQDQRHDHPFDATRSEAGKRFERRDLQIFMGLPQTPAEGLDDPVLGRAQLSDDPDGSHAQPGIRRIKKSDQFLGCGIHLGKNRFRLRPLLSPPS